MRRDIGWLMLVFGWLLIALGVPAKADLLTAFYMCDNTSTTTHGVVGPLVVPFSCGGGQSTTGTLSVNYGPLGQGSRIDFSGDGLAEGETFSTATLSISSSTVPLGMPIDVTVSTTFKGSYSYTVAPTSVIKDLVTGDVELSGTPVASFTEDGLYFCSPSNLGVIEHGEKGCDAGFGTISAVGSGKISVPIVSNTLLSTVGSLTTLVLGEAQEIEFQGTFVGDFLDPFILTNIEVTNPDTGKPISGITITDASGIHYPVNVNNVVPEPGSIALVGSAVVLLGLLRGKRRA